MFWQALDLAKAMLLWVMGGNSCLKDLGATLYTRIRGLDGQWILSNTLQAQV